MKFRNEHDCIGPKEVPENAMYGAQTQRAFENFHITGIPISHYPHIIYALAHIKKRLLSRTINWVNWMMKKHRQ